MEEEKLVDVTTGSGSSGAGSTASTSRWVPTKEQISTLEGLYRQGLRTPSADQIQQITNRLRAYGHIEGKNVFYWFQNHKARQRQKQKQENVVYINRFLRNVNPIVPSPCINARSPFCVRPPSTATFSPQFPKVVQLPGKFKRTLGADEALEEMIGRGGYCYQGAYPSNHYANFIDRCMTDRETLELFPLHPTGILEDKLINNSPGSSSSEVYDLPVAAETTDDNGIGAHPLHNFL